MEDTPSPAGAPYHRLRGDQGAPLSIALTYVDPDGQPVDLSAATGTCTILAAGTGEQLAQTTVPGTDDGLLDFTFAAAETATWPPGRSAYTIDVHHLGSDPDRILVGALDLREAHRV